MTGFQIAMCVTAAGTAAFLFVAVILLLVVPSHWKKKNTVCIQPVSARIAGSRAIRLSPNSHGIRRAPNYAFLYEFVWQGETLCRESSFTSSKKPVTGEMRTLMINPQNPDQFVDPQEQARARVIVRIVGVAMLVIGLAFACAFGSLLTLAF